MRQCFARRRAASVPLCWGGNSTTGSNAHWDPRGEYFVVKATRAMGPTLFQPEHALILNIEEEHLDFYADLAAIERCLRIDRSDIWTLLYCADNPHAGRICGARSRCISFGFAPRRIIAARISIFGICLVVLCLLPRREVGRSSLERSWPP